MCVLFRLNLFTFEQPHIGSGCSVEQHCLMEAERSAGACWCALSWGGVGDAHGGHVGGGVQADKEDMRRSWFCIYFLIHSFI